jgi:peroxiredoxin
VSATTPTVAAQITELQERQRASGRLPADVAARFGDEQAALDTAGIPDGVLAPGSPMPDGELLDVRGDATTLADARDGRAAVVVLYRGGWCPFCSLTLRAYEEQLLGDLAQRGVALIAVSPQTPDGSLSAQEANALTYSVLSDPGNQIAKALGVLFVPAEETRAAQRELGLDTTVVNADGTGELPMPTVALVDEAGTLRWIDVHPNYTTRTEPTAILKAVDAAGQGCDGGETTPIS